MPAELRPHRRSVQLFYGLCVFGECYDRASQQRAVVIAGQERQVGVCDRHAARYASSSAAR